MEQSDSQRCNIVLEINLVDRWLTILDQSFIVINRYEDAGFNIDLIALICGSLPVILAPQFEFTSPFQHPMNQEPNHIASCCFIHSYMILFASACT